MFDWDNLDKTVKDERQIKALIWVNIREFKFLAELFSEIQTKVREEAYKERKEKKEKEKSTKQVRISSKWNPAKLDTDAKKIFFLLYYLKTYPTFDVLGFAFWMDRSTACVNIHGLFPLLKRLFVELWIAPKREIHTIEDLKEAFDGDIVDLIIDGTERRHFRHKDYEKQKENYSGKKKCHTKKNTIISNEKQYIWCLWPTVPWKSHDYSMFKEEFLEKKEVFVETTVLADLWFLWIVKDFWDSVAGILIPEKKPKASKNNPEPKLTKEQKESNKIISSFRVKVENSIGWAKRFGAVTQVFRNKSEKLNDLVMELACSLWNMHIVF